MKKILIFIIGLVCLCSCTIVNRTQNEKNVGISDNTSARSHIKLVNIEFNGEVHEYVFMEYGYGKSLSHWEGCKYCKESKKEVNMVEYDRI